MTTLIQIPEQVTDKTQQLSLKKPRIFADFHNADPQGRLRLNCIGTIEDFAKQGIELALGQEFTFYSEELQVDGTIEYSQSENVWVAIIDWDNIREIEESYTELTHFNESLKESMEKDEVQYPHTVSTCPSLPLSDYCCVIGNKERISITEKTL